LLTRRCETKAIEFSYQERVKNTFNGGYREEAKKQYAVILLTLTSFLGLVVVAEGQGQHEVTVTVPFDFVAAGNALPAGSYKVSRVAEDGFSGLIMRNDETGARVIVLPNQLESNATDDLKVSFKQIGDARFLNKIGTQTVSIPCLCPSHSR
jgi:hypothetical protein